VLQKPLSTQGLTCFIYSILAVVFAVRRGFAVGLYTTNSPDACHYVLENGSCQIVVVENETQLNKILQVKDRLPELRSIIQYRGEPPSDCLDVLTVRWLDSSTSSYNILTSLKVHSHRHN